MQVLGIETSCDETAAAVVAETGDATRPWRIRSNIVASQTAIHREWGGIVPELASRQHVRDICGVVERALVEANTTWKELDAIAVTQGPGLVGSLLVGVSFAKSIALSLDVPLVAVHHLAGHIDSLVLENGPMPVPAVVLVVSGGHTNLYYVPIPGEYRLVGRTRDDAAGEAYDKVAKLLGLGYPGGPIVDRLAREGNEHAIEFPVAKITHADRVATTLPADTGPFARMLAGRADFSFSGLKTAVLHYVKRRGSETGAVAGRTAGQVVAQVRPLSETEVADVCASFQRAVVDALLDRTLETARWFDARSIGIAGGVSANSRLRADAAERAARMGLPLFLPSLALATDNAAMIAAAGLRRFRAGVTATWDLNAEANLVL